jgi:hypothetical protein
MPQLNIVYYAKQASKNSCWACAARMIINFYSGSDLIKTDQALGDAWFAATQVAKNKDIESQQSASGALTDLGYKNNMDGKAIPKASEIEKEIEAGKPLLAIIADNKITNNKREKAAQEGHWVVITGIEIANNAATLTVFDPDDGKLSTMDYGPKHKNGWYWQNTSYVDNKN